MRHLRVYHRIVGRELERGLQSINGVAVAMQPVLRIGERQTRSDVGGSELDCRFIFLNGLIQQHLLAVGLGARQMNGD